MAKKRNEDEEGPPKKAKREHDTGKLEESQGVSEDDNEQLVNVECNNRKKHKSRSCSRKLQTLSATTRDQKRKKSSHSEQNDANEQTQNASETAMEKKDQAKNKSKKKRDRRGQIVDDVGNTQDAAHEDMDGGRQTLMEKKDKAKKKSKKKRDRWGQIVDDVGDTQDAAHEDMDGGRQTLIERDGFKSHKDEYDSKTVCVGGMPYDTTEEDILGFFAECGTVAHVLCMRFADTQRFKGLAFITFKTEAAASKALALDGSHMGGRCIKVDQAKRGGKVLRDPPKREPGSLSVYIGNLVWDVKKIDVMRFFKGCDIENVRLAVDKSTGEFRGYGHVDFSDDVSLQKAIKMDQEQLFGRPVKVSYAVPNGFKSKLG